MSNISEKREGAVLATTLLGSMKLPAEFGNIENADVQVKNCRVSICQIKNNVAVDFVYHPTNTKDVRPFPRLNQVRFTAPKGQASDRCNDVEATMLYEIGKGAFHDAHVKVVGGPFDRRVVVECRDCDGNILPANNHFSREMAQICRHMTDNTMVKLVGGHIKQEFGLEGSNNGGLVTNSNSRVIPHRIWSLKSGFPVDRYPSESEIQIAKQRAEKVFDQLGVPENLRNGFWRYDTGELEHTDGIFAEGIPALIYTLAKGDEMAVQLAVQLEVDSHAQKPLIVLRVIYRGGDPNGKDRTQYIELRERCKLQGQYIAMQLDLVTLKTKAYLSYWGYRRLTLIDSVWSRFGDIAEFTRARQSRLSLRRTEKTISRFRDEPPTGRIRKTLAGLTETEKAAVREKDWFSFFAATIADWGEFAPVDYLP